jgi:hypothetical protein
MLTGLSVTGARVAMAIGLASAPAAGQPAKDAPSTLATLFGHREQVRNIALSPDGKHAVFVTPGPGMVTYAAVIDVETREIHPAGKQNGKPLSIDACGWSSDSRIVCTETGVAFDSNPPIPYTRTISVDADGKNAIYLGRGAGPEAVRVSQYDGASSIGCRATELSL